MLPGWPWNCQSIPPLRIGIGRSGTQKSGSSTLTGTLEEKGRHHMPLEHGPRRCVSLQTSKDPTGHDRKGTNFATSTSCGKLFVIPFVEFSCVEHVGDLGIPVGHLWVVGYGFQARGFQKFRHLMKTMSRTAETHETGQSTFGGSFLECRQQEFDEIKVPDVTNTDLLFQSLRCRSELGETHNASVVDQNIKS